MKKSNINNGQFEGDQTASSTWESFNESKQDFNYLESTKATVEEALAAANGVVWKATLAEVNAINPLVVDTAYGVYDDGVNNGYYYWDGSSSTVDFNRPLGLDKDDFSSDPVDLQNDFVDNIVGIESFNGGVASHDAVNDRARIVAATVDDGCKVTPDNLVDNQEYLVYVDIDINNIDRVSFLNNNNPGGTIAEITESGVYQFKITTDLSGSFPFPWFRPRSAGEFYINEIRFTRLSKNVYALKKDFLKSQPEIIREYDSFPSIPSDISQFNGATISEVNDEIRVVSSTHNKGVQFTGLTDGVEYVATLKLNLNGLPYVKFLNYFDNEITRITSNSEVNIRFTKENIGAFPNPILAPDEAGTFFLQSLKITTGDDKAYVDEVKTLVDEYAPNYTGEDKQFRDYGAGTTAESVHVGEGGKSSYARSTSVGDKSFQLGQSGTVVGTGAENTTSHGAAIGRGSIMNFWNDAISLGGRAATKLFMGSTWAHRYRMPFSLIGAGHDQTPKDRSVEISGSNAWDYRPYDYDFAVTYSRYDEVYFNGRLYLSKANGNVNNTPVQGGDVNWTDLNQDVYETSEYYPTGILAATTPVAFTSGVGIVGRVYSDNGEYYILKDMADINTSPASNSSFVLVTPAFSNGQVKADFFKKHNPSTYNTGEITVLWETIWISKIDNNNSEPPKNRQDNASWYAVYSNNLKTFWQQYDLFRHYDTRHEVNIEGGDLDLLAGRGTGTEKGGLVNIKTHKSNASETDGNKQGVLENVAQFHSETNTDTRFRILDNVTGQMQDVKYYTDAQSRKVLYID